MELISDIIYARNYARSRQVWLVIVVPDDRLEQTAKLLSSSSTDGDICGGRTVRLQGGGQVSVSPATKEVFVPKGQPFYVMFIGWGNKVVAPQEMAKWRSTAKQVVRAVA